jgi:hypothetical protein
VSLSLDEFIGLRDKIKSIIASLPTSSQKESAARIRFIEDFFVEDASDTEELLRQFDDDCLGPR